MTGLVHDAPKRSKTVLRKYFKGWVCVFSLSEKLLTTSVVVLAALNELAVHLRLLFNQSCTDSNSDTPNVFEFKYCSASGWKKKTKIRVP